MDTLCESSEISRSESKEVTEAFGGAGGESRCDLTGCVFVTICHEPFQRCLIAPTWRVHKIQKAEAHVMRIH